MSLEEEYDLPRNNPFKKWLWLMLILALVAGGSYVYATNLGGIRDALATVRENAGTVMTDSAATDSTLTESTTIGDATASVDPATLPDPRVQDLSRRLADLELRSAVRDAVDRHPEFANARVRVEAVDGEVTLSGSVEDAAQQEAVLQIAVREGAGGIVDELEIRGTSDGLEDAGTQLARQVEFELYSTDAFDLDRLEITAAAGEVRLGGSVRSLAERLLAERIAAEVAGVDSVINELDVPESRS